MCGIGIHIPLFINKGLNWYNLNENDPHNSFLVIHIEAFALLTPISPKGIPSGDYALLRSPWESYGQYDVSLSVPPAGMPMAKGIPAVQ